MSLIKYLFFVVIVFGSQPILRSQFGSDAKNWIVDRFNPIEVGYDPNDEGPVIGSLADNLHRVLWMKAEGVELKPSRWEEIAESGCSVTWQDDPGYYQREYGDHLPNFLSQR